MPYKSLAQAAYFNIHRKELEREGVDVDEWNNSTRGKKLPKKVKKAGLLDVELLLKQASADFKPDYTPDQLKEMGVYKEVYGKKEGPRLASLEAWPSHWYHPEDKKGWLEWYQKYSAGRRMEDDTRQINRWKAFKARHGGPAFQSNPTPRRAFALRNWGIDASKLVKDPASLQKVMEAYRAKQYEKAASASILKVATTIGATKALLRFLKSEGVQLYRNSNVLAKNLAGGLEIPAFFAKRDPQGYKRSIIKGIKHQVESTGPAYMPENNAIFIPRGKFVQGVGRKPVTVRRGSRSIVAGYPRDSFFHEGGHAIHFNEDPSLFPLILKRLDKGESLNANTILAERIANNNAINFMRGQKTPNSNIQNYINSSAPGYKGYLNHYESLQNTPSALLFHKRPKTPFNQIPKDSFSVDLGSESL